jgi:hypothetical protein
VITERRRAMATREKVEQIKREINEFRNDVSQQTTAAMNRVDDANVTDQELTAIEDNVAAWRQQAKQGLINKRQPGPGFAPYGNK